MGNTNNETTTANGNNNNQEDDTFSTTTTTNTKSYKSHSNLTLYDVVSTILSSILYPDPDSNSSFFQRTKESLTDNLPHLREGSRNTGLNILKWARQGSSLRLLLVISVGTITLLTLTGVLVFFLVLAAATVNTIILSLFVSLAAAGGFLAIFFACVAGIYIGALAIAFFVVSAATISAIITVLVVTGWIGFFWIVWLVVSRSASFAKHSVTVAGSAVTAYTSGRHGHQRRDRDD